MPVLSAFAPLLRFALANRPFLAFGFVMTLGSSFGQTYFIGLFSDAIRDAFALSAGQYGALYSGGTLASALTLVWLGKRIDRLDLRLYALLVCLGLVLACLLLATALAPAMLVVAFFALRLSGQGLMTHTAHTAMGRYFDHERGKALSLAALAIRSARRSCRCRPSPCWPGWAGAGRG